MPTGAVGLITEPKQASKVPTDGSADVVTLARAARAALAARGLPLC
jgi:hypothetical protein